MWEFICKYWLEFLFGIIGAALTAAYGWLVKKFNEEHKKTQAIENGVRDMLRLTILDNYERCKAAGVISVARKDAVDSAYNSYHALGGNGTVTQVHKEIMEMPIIK